MAGHGAPDLSTVDASGLTLGIVAARWHAELTDQLMARAKDNHEPARATVTFATLHAAKGLEWDHVHLVGLAEGLLPISYARSFDEIDEERRLAYVGITRAARTLSLSWAPGLGRTPRQPSRFLQEIGTRILDERPARARSVGRSQAGGARRAPSEHRRS